MSRKEKCVLAGAGPAVLETAAILSNQRPELEPVVFEKDGDIGGRAKGYMIDGFWIDHGQHYSLALGKTAEKMGWAPFWFTSKCAELAGANLTYKSNDYPAMAFMHAAFPGKVIFADEIHPKAENFDLELTKKCFPFLNDAVVEELTGLFDALLDTARQSKELIKAVQTDRNYGRVPGYSLGEWLRERNPSDAAARFLKYMAGYYAAIPVEDAEKGNVFLLGNMFYGLVFDWIRYAYPVNPDAPKYGAWAAEVFAYRDVLLKNNGKIYTNSPVKKIIIQDKKVTGVVVARGGKEVMVETNLVISELNPALALDSGVLDEKELPREWVDGVRKAWETECTYNSGYVMAAFCLKKPVTTNDFWTVVMDEEGEMIGGIEPQRNPDSSPPGKQVLTMMRWFKFDHPADMNMKVAQEVVNGYLLPHLRLHYENFDDLVEYCLIWARPYVWDQTYVNPEIYRSPIEVPGVEGLYWVGNWSDSSTVLTIKCAASAITCAEKILGKTLAPDPY